MRNEEVPTNPNDWQSSRGVRRDLTSPTITPAELESALAERLGEARARRETAKSRPRGRRRIPMATFVVGAGLLMAVFVAGVVSAVVSDGGTCNVRVSDKTQYSGVCTTTAGATVEYLGDSNTTFGSAGTGTFNSFVRVQAAPTEQGYNTNGTLQFDTKSGNWTHAIKVSEIPVVNYMGSLYWELFSDINDGNNTPLISLNDMEVWFTADANLTGYPFGTAADKVYDYHGDILINDVNQGSGRGDLRFRIPLAGISIPTDCGYGDAGCGTYFVLYNQWGTTSSDYASDGGFEEWKVKQYPTIKIVKNTVGGDDTFDYTVTGPSAPLVPAPSIITSGGTGATITYIVDPGTYTIDENGPPAGWSLTNSACSINGGSAAAYTPGSDIVLGETTHVVCTFTNTKDGRIEIEKQTLPDGDPASFTFTGDVGGSLSDGQSAGQNVAPGSYSSTETVPSGWTLTDITCDDTDSSGDTSTGVASFVVAAGETVRCTFTNTKDGRIEIEKQTLPDGDPASFTFTGDVGGSLSDGQSAGQNVAPGSYSSTETVPSGWTLTDITCDDTDSSGDTSTGVASFVVAAGETVRCTFTNTKDGRIEIEKQTLPDGDPASFTFTGDVGGSLSDGQSAGQNVAPGSYSSTETVPSGWTLTDITCDDTDSSGDTSTGVASFVVAAGETVRCTFTNTKDGRIEIEKQTLPDGDPASFTFTGDVGGSLSDGQSAGQNVAPGSYSSTETVPSGWTLTDITCDDTDSSGDTSTGVASFVVAAGETVRCTFTNTKDGRIEIEKQTLPDGDPASFTFTGDVGGSLSDGQSAGQNVAPGSYSSTETVPSGWTLTDITCDDTDSSGDTSTGVASFVVAAGETVRCTFTNTKDGRIEIEKQTLPDGDPASFTFTGDVGGSLSDGQSAGQNVAPGSYSSTETVPSGWTLTDITCDDTDSSGDTSTGVASFVVAAGETVRCTFTNTKDGRIEIEKQTLPDGDPASFTFTGDVGGSLSDGQSAGQNVAPGSYSSTETVPSGWTLTDITCDDTDSSGDTSTGVASFVVAAGETVRCTFTNEKQVSEGCTPGFWQGGFGIKLWNEMVDGDWSGAGSNPIYTTQVFSDYFAPTGDSSVDDASMLDIVGSGGTNNWPRKAARDLIAAYLNSSYGLAYPYSTTEIVNDWNSVASGDTAGYKWFHARYGAANELGCPIGGGSEPITLSGFIGIGVLLMAGSLGATRVLRRHRRR